MHQEVTAGDADQLVDSNTLSVSLINIDKKAVNDLRLPTRAFTPNGDGTNDLLRIQYELLNLGAVPVAIDLYNLSGRRIGEIYRGTAASGSFEVTWNGRDAQANLVPPGLYILRLEVDSDGGWNRRNEWFRWFIDLRTQQVVRDMERILKRISWAVLSAVLGTAAYGQGAGHQVTANQIVVDRTAHWRNWTFPQGVVKISPSGALTPHQLHRDINAVQDIAAYLQARPPEGVKKAPEEITVLDGIQAGTAGNRADVVNLFDGDLETYWQPDPPTVRGELASQWWFVVDLGRLVMAKSIVLKFVDEEFGRSLPAVRCAGVPG